MKAAARWVGMVVLVALLVLPITLSLSMSRGLNHDEHQHLAAGALFAREALLPYRDFPYFHTPHLVFVYAWLFETGGYLLVKARAFSAICAALTAGVLFAAAWHALRRWEPRARWVASLSALALLLCNPTFHKASGAAWNQDPSMLCALAAVVILLAASETKRQGLILFASGLLLGFAAGLRITWAPIGLPMLCVIAFARQYDRRRLPVLLTTFSLGALIGLAPLIWLFVIAPEQTLFNNFEFPKVNIAYRFATGEPRTMTLLSKLRYFWKEVVRTDVLSAVAAVCAVLWWRTKQRAGDPLWLTALVAVTPFVLLGSFAPSPLFYQYFYAPVPFVILAVVFAVAAIWSRAPGFRSMASVLLAGVAVAVGLAAPLFDPVEDLFTPANWTSTKQHDEAQPLSEKAPPGRVLTLAPLPVLEAGFKVYPAFSTGPFAWRVASFVGAEKRSRLHIVSQDELETYLRNDPPAAILLGYEKKGEEPLAEYARAHGYHSQSFGKNEAKLWLRPARRER